MIKKQISDGIEILAYFGSFLGHLRYYLTWVNNGKDSKSAENICAKNNLMDSTFAENIFIWETFTNIYFCIDAKLFNTGCSFLIDVLLIK